MARRPKISPQVWRPAKAPKSAPDPLPPLTVVPVNGNGAEDVLVDKGHVFTGVDDGRILRLTPDGRRLDLIVDTGGRPLGLERYPDGRLLVCDAKRGLLLVSRQTGEVEVLVARGPGLRVCNNAAVAKDGTVYFTDSTSRFELEHWKADLLEHSGTGRLLRRSPDGTVDVLLSGLFFANGVALAPDESYVVVASTGSYRLDKIELPSGRHVVLDDNLPGIPDNISTGSDGLVWVALASARVPALDIALRLHPAVRKAVWALPESLQMKDKRVVWVRAVDGSDGRVVHDFRGARPDYHLVTGVREYEGVVYMGSLEERAVAYFSLPGR
ncbi:SMP-30/gluconolactonase/LRE family protein [Actinophytocola oryzae]|uniref:Strictosidine synthase n=1 Tax=Actinophytocola oryzae TaxID=502181 RepID=A0A4R7VQT1_9PSEU|nr:SMP-30/gluconolactonase/LRE family protein [Actinophytocola oryzae]TDV51992.1 strictosidine synthase [Actinophytocola oryzae]